jgi:hypothetical protein
MWRYRCMLLSRWRATYYQNVDPRNCKEGRLSCYEWKLCILRKRRMSFYINLQGNLIRLFLKIWKHLPGFQILLNFLVKHLMSNIHLLYWQPNFFYSAVFWRVPCQIHVWPFLNIHRWGANKYNLLYSARHWSTRFEPSRPEFKKFTLKKFNSPRPKSVANPFPSELLPPLTHSWQV